MREPRSAKDDVDEIVYERVLLSIEEQVSCLVSSQVDDTFDLVLRVVADGVWCDIVETMWKQNK